MGQQKALAMYMEEERKNTKRKIAGYDPSELMCHTYMSLEIILKRKQQSKPCVSLSFVFEQCLLNCGEF